MTEVRKSPNLVVRFAQLFLIVDDDLEKVIAWIDERDPEAEEWLNELAAERFNLRPESETASYLNAVLSADLIPD